MSDQNDHSEANKTQRSRDSSPRPLLYPFWPSAKKERHTNPGGVLGVRKAQRRSEFTPERDMNLSIECLTRRPLGNGTIHLPYNHATKHDRIAATLNGVIHEPPSPPTMEGTSRSEGIKRERVVDDRESQPPKKKRRKMSLNRHTSSKSTCSSGSSSPCSSTISSLQYVSCSSTPPISPVSLKIEATEENPLSRKGKRKGSTPSRKVRVSKWYESKPMEVMLIDPSIQRSTSLEADTPPSPGPNATPPSFDAPPVLDTVLPLNATPSPDTKHPSVDTSSLRPDTQPLPVMLVSSEIQQNASQDAHTPPPPPRPTATPSPVTKPLSLDTSSLCHDTQPLPVMLVSSAGQQNVSQDAHTPPGPTATPSPDTTPTSLETPPPCQHLEVETILLDDEPQPGSHDISQWCEGRMAFTCDLSDCKPIDKFSSGHLENYAEMVSKEGDLENYLNTAERLVNHGRFFPINKLDEVFRVLWRCRSEQAAKRMHFILKQDLSLRTDTSMKESHFSHWMKKSLESLRSNKRVLLARVQLSYLHNLLIKNLDAHRDSLKSSLVEQLLSIKKTLNINTILDTIFSLPKRTAHSVLTAMDASLLTSLLGMICLPLLTSDPANRPELRTKLAREFAIRLDKMSSRDTQCQLINAIPSNYLKEKVIDFVLERNFDLPYERSAAQAFSDDSVSFAKIISLHLHRSPRAPQDLPFFIQLLSSLIQSHLLTVTSGQPLVSLLPLDTPLPDHYLVDSAGLSNDGQLQEALLDLHHGVLLLTERLSRDEAYVEELTEPSTWFLLQLLSLTTSLS